MNRNRLYVVCLAAISQMAFGSYAMTSEEMLHNWKTIEAEELKKEENAVALERIRTLANNPHFDDARALMVRYGDLAVINVVLSDYWGKSFRWSRSASSSLYFSKQPMLIPLLEKDFSKDESPLPLVKEGCWLVDPKSVESARIVRTIIIESSVFPQPVKSWASSLPNKFVGGELRTSISAWFTQNKHLFASGDFKSMRPPSEIEKPPSSTADSAAISSPIVSKPSPTPTPF